MTRDKIIATTVFKKDYILVWGTGFWDNAPLPAFDKTDNDIQVTLKTPSGEYLGDAICHWGSYGVKDGLWETMINGIEDVTGHLTFEEVIKQFNWAVKRHIKSAQSGSAPLASGQGVEEEKNERRTD